MKVLEFGLVMLLMIVLVVAQNALIGLPFALWGIYFFSGRERYSELVIMSFVAGVVSDGLAMGVIGWSSLFYLLFILVVYVLREQFSLSKVFELLALQIGGVLWFIIFGEYKGLVSGLLLIIVTFILFFVTSKFEVKKELVLGKIR